MTRDRVNQLQDDEAAITLENVSMNFGTFTALRPTDLKVKSGEFLTLLGPSGSGKSTLLNLIAGSLAPTTGRILLGGRDITFAPPRERGIGMVFQNYALMPHMSVFENVAYPLRIRREPKDVIGKKVHDALARVGLEGFDERKPKQMSGGQQQRVGIARCIVYSPSIIMMDEPLGALDKNLREQMQDEIKRLHTDLGTTFIYVTHDQEEALNMSDRICLMNVGGISQLGTPDELYFEPRNRFVAEFIGESNLISGRITGRDRFLANIGGEYAVPSREIAVGQECRLMIRPERLMMSSPENEPAAGRNSLRGRIIDTSFIGGMTRIQVEMADGMVVTSKAISEHGRAGVQAGTEVLLEWDPVNSVVLTD
ncbi:spermidine/putrescine ABC transporter ATP-binding protein [Pseudorhizobium endolithicum]|uniref:Spermidine/putrescine ABC transporter ATP-binding protein n=1 Tax=Pseudorhizobium endolithicum TaxID=1191678 RepID=A0ABN7JM13_9HYPH|nr:ABC transporter ATP-binding protein [Pseudorhizobium endolithicum]CAD7037639.1 spermidine/putrescine ABC transporter ATP-binding protein [Pseudorhizobium endolithicum]